MFNARLEVKVIYHHIHLQLFGRLDNVILVSLSIKIRRLIAPQIMPMVNQMEKPKPKRHPQEQKEIGIVQADRVYPVRWMLMYPLSSPNKFLCGDRACLSPPPQ